ncbi:beta strand repeat-containing protein [Maridesulfovibrio sp.]|uniref:beta strand repeat-containing protein n=1 Tax=Maridesulfovibrio sp. TaxID=2795000 RepID=UPI0039F12F5D
MKMSKKMKQAITVAAIAGTVALSGTAFAATNGWKTQTLGATGSNLYELAVGKITAGAFPAVAVGDAGKIYYVADVQMNAMKATSWNQAAVPTVNTITAVATTTSGFVATTDKGEVLTSSDAGKTWAKVKNLPAGLTGENIMDVSTINKQTLLVTKTGKVFYTADVETAATTAAWKQLYLTKEGTSTGTALDVASDLRGLVNDGTSTFFAFGGAAAISRVNVSGGSNTQITNIAELTRKVSSTATAEKFGSYAITAMATDGASWYIAGEGGRVANVTFNGALASAVSTTAKVSDSGATVQAWTQPVTENITSINLPEILAGSAQHGYFTTVSGAVYRLARLGATSDIPLFESVKTLGSQLNAVAGKDAIVGGVDTFRAVAAGASGIMANGKDIEWKAASTADPNSWAINAASGNLWALKAANDLEFGTDYTKLANVNVQPTDATVGSLSVNGNYVSLIKSTGPNKGLVVYAADTGTQIGDSAANNPVLGAPAKGTALFTKGGETYLAYADTANHDQAVFAKLTNGYTVTQGVANEKTSGSANEFNALGSTTNFVWGIDTDAGAKIYAADVSTADVAAAALTLPQVTPTGDALSANLDTIVSTGSTFIYLLDTTNETLFKVTENTSGAPVVKAIAAPTGVSVDGAFYSNGALYLYDTTSVTKKIFRLVDESNSYWEEYGSPTDSGTAADIDQIAAIGNYVWSKGNGAGTDVVTEGVSWGQLDSKLSATSAFNDVVNATGAFYAAGGGAMLYKSTDGTTWNLDTDLVEAFPSASINVVRVNGSNVYAVDNAAKKVYKYDTATWVQYPTGKTFTDNAVDLILSAEDKGLMLSATQVWDFSDFTSKGVSGLAGATSFVQLGDSSYLIACTGGKLWSYDGDKTIKAVTTDTTKNLNALYAKSASEVYVVGQSGYFAKYDGTKVTQIETGNNDLVKGKTFTDVWGYGNFVYLTDGTSVFKYDGANFFDEQVQSANITALTGNEKIGGLVAVGASGTVQYRAIGNSGLVMLPGQTNKFTYTSRSAAATTPDTLNATYGVDNSTLKLLGDQMTFTASITAGETATVGFSFQATANASKTSDIGLIKLIGGKGTALKHFYFNQSSEVTTDAGKYYITSTTPESDGKYKALTGDLTVGKDYYVWFNIKDDGNGDLNKNAGLITDPVVATTSGGATVSSSSSSGCVFNPAAGFGLEWLMLMAAPMIAVIRNRFKK